MIGRALSGRGLRRAFVGSTALTAVALAGALPSSAVLAAGGNGGQDIIFGQGPTGVGGQGYNGSDGADVASVPGDAGGAGGGGAGGGAGGSVVGYSSTTGGGAGGSPTSVDGQNGANSAGGFGGGGGGGGAHGTTTGSLSNTSPLRGGNGGNGGNGGQAGGGGGGGAGGYGAVVTGAGSNANSATITGGNGGNGGAGGAGGVTVPGNYGANGGSGGDGGIGVLFTQSGATFVNSGSVIGGRGGSGGAAGPGTLVGTASGLVRQPGVAGAGGAGIYGAGLTVVNSGTIEGGLSGDGVTRADAITFIGGANRLELQAGSTIIGNVVVHTGNRATGTLALGGAGSGVFDVSNLGPTGQYQGFSTFEKTGESTWNLTGRSGSTGPWSVTGGLLAVNATLSNAPFDVTNGGTLGGTGLIGGLVVGNGGTVAPGNSIGQLNVAGNVTFQPGSTYRLEIDNAGNSDRISATGTASLNGGNVQVIAAPGTYRANTQYTILTANGGVSGRFASLSTSSTDLAFLSPILSYEANSVLLELQQIARFTDVAHTHNQYAVASAVQALGAGNSIYDAVLYQGEAGAHQAFDALSGEVHSSAATAAVQTAFVVQETLFDRMRWGDSTGVAGPGLTGSIGQRFAPGTTLPAAYSADLPGRTVISKVPVRPIEPSYAVWGQAFGSFGDTGGNGNAARMTRQIGGFVVGAETGAGALGGSFSEWRAGVAAGYSYTSFDVSARGSTGQVESAFGAVYARGPLGPLQMRLGAAYAGNAFDTRRVVAFPGFSQTLTGKEGGQTVQGFGELGYRITTSTGYIEPFVGGAAIHIARDGFTERGGAAALQVFGRDYDIQTTTAGVQGQAVVSDTFASAGPLVARGLLGYRHAFGDVVPTTLLAFTGGGQSFLTAGVPVARDAFIASAGLDLQVAKNTSIGLAYNGQIGEQAQDHSVRGNFSYRW